MDTLALTLHEACERPTELSRVAELYETHQDGLYRFLVCQGMSPSEAQESVQDAFVDLHKALLKGAVIHTPERWLYRVAGRAACDYWRRHHRQKQVPLPAEAETSLYLSAREPSPETAARERQRLTRIAAGVQQLPMEQRLCLQLRMKGLRYREIAKTLDTPISTVADRLTAAVTFLRKQCE